MNGLYKALLLLQLCVAGSWARFVVQDAAHHCPDGGKAICALIDGEKFYFDNECLLRELQKTSPIELDVLKIALSECEESDDVPTAGRSNVVKRRVTRGLSDIFTSIGSGLSSITSGIGTTGSSIVTSVLTTLGSIVTALFGILS